MLNILGSISRAESIWRSGEGALRRKLLTSVAMVMLCAPLGACGMNNKVMGAPEIAYDYRDRHPVVLAEAPYQIDLFPGAGARLDSETVLRIKQFVAEYHKFGEGQISLLAPRGRPNNSRRATDEVRRALAAFGAGRSIYIGSYPIADPSLAAPIRLSFNGVKAKVAGPCGEWPDDLASGGSLEGWQNKTFYNYGCAAQATLSAQIADPRDLAEPRGETPSDVETRMRAIGKIRQGADPSTSWNTKSATIGGVGGN